MSVDARVTGEHVLMLRNLLSRVAVGAQELVVTRLQLKLPSFVEINEARPKR